MKPLAKFSLKSDGQYHAYCRPCATEYSREWRARFKARDPLGYKDWQATQNAKARPGARDRHLRRTYGISAEEFAILIQRQDGHCALCPSNHAMTPDHDHETGKLRGALCHLCNIAVGRVADTPQGLAVLTAYLTD